MKKGYKIAALALVAIIIAVLLIPNPIPQERTLSAEDSAQIRQQVEKELGDLPQRADSMRKADSLAR